MTKHSARAPVPVDDFEPFYIREGLLWVPYISGGKTRIHTLMPEMAFKGISYALKVLGSSGKVVPFTLRALKRDRPMASN
jgi:hypothetical protein